MNSAAIDQYFYINILLEFH